MSALRSDSVCIFFSTPGALYAGGHLFPWLCFVQGLAFGVLFKKCSRYPEDWQTVPGLVLRVYCVLLEVWREGGSQSEGRREVFLSPFAVELWAPDKIKEVIGIDGEEGTNSWWVHRLHQG